jgi:hypothetical protein
MSYRHTLHAPRLLLRMEALPSRVRPAALMVAVIQPAFSHFTEGET